VAANRSIRRKLQKVANDYIGKREDSPALYQIEAKNIEEMLKSADSLKPAMPSPTQK